MYVYACLYIYSIYTHIYLGVCTVHIYPVDLPSQQAFCLGSAELSHQVCILSIWRREEQNKACIFTAGTFAHEIQISVCQAFSKR